MADSPTTSEPPTQGGDSNGPDAPLFECLAEFEARREAGESVATEAYRDRLGPHFERFRQVLEFDQALGTSIEPSAAANLPRILPGRYSDFRPVAEGGMGVVYWAIDNNLNREVAFKVIKPKDRIGLDPTPSAPLSMASPRAGTPGSHAFRALTQRFLQEAWVTSGMTHPGIVPVYELGQTRGGVPYYTMRFVKGERTLLTAIEEIRNGPVEERLALLEPFLKVCDTIRYAHDRGVVHRDLKPQNIALGEFGEVVVLDWGLAKLGGQEDQARGIWQERVDEYRSATDLATVTAALGTPGYMAPEAARGDIEAVDERSDVYSLGAVLFQILTGRVPFDFDTYAQFVAKLLAQRPPRADDLEPRVPSELADLCHSALQTEADARPQSVGALADAVRAWQSQSALEREVNDLLREARGALEAGDAATGKARLFHVERAVAALERVDARMPDHAPAARYRARAVRLRELGMKEQERATTRRLLRRGGVLVLAVATIATVLVAGALDRRAEEARKERDEKAAALASVLRLSDVKRARDLEVRAKQMRVKTPDLEATAKAWLDEARSLTERRGEHAAALQTVRSQARSGASPLAFDAPELAWKHEVLSELIERLEALSDKEAPLTRRVYHMHDLAQRVREAETVHADAWAQTLEAIAASERYGGLRIGVQRALVPLGPDPGSGLQEFAHIGSGRLPQRDPATGLLELEDDFAIVLVLVPGGTFNMGAQSRDATRPNYDPEAGPGEAPVHDVTLSPFFMAKFEVTQAQWKAMHWDRNPSRLKGDRRPVENVSWDEFAGVLPWYGLNLPTEAQWEYADRAGTSTPWWTGSDPEETRKAGWFPGPGQRHPSGARGTSRVGLYRPNPFGLHDTIGGIKERCLDTYMPYESSPATDPMVRVGFKDIVFRGGYDPSSSRAARRGPVGRTYYTEEMGARAARAIDGS